MESRILYFNLLAAFNCLFILNADGEKMTYQNVWQHLLAKYDKRIRPVSNASDVLHVSANVHVDHVIALDAKSQTLSLKIWYTMLWKDTFLQFNSTEVGVTSIAADCQDIWTPHIVLYESLDKGNGGLIEKQGFPKVNATGHVLWIPEVVTKSMCLFKIQDYPLDIQICNLTFGSWVYDNKGLRMTWNDHYDYNRTPAHSGEWEVYPVTCKIITVDFGEQHEAPFDLVHCQLVLARKPLFYIINLVIPCLLLLLVGSATFFLPVNSGEKVSLSVTILLAMTVFMLVLMDNLPPTSDAVPFLGKFIVSCAFLLAMSTAMAVSIVNLSSRGVTEILCSPPPRWLQGFVIKFLARVVCYNPRVITKLQKNENKSSKPNRSDFILHHRGGYENNENSFEDTACQTEDGTGYNTWVAIALILDRLYFIIYFVMLLTLVITVIAMSSRAHTNLNVM